MNICITPKTGALHYESGPPTVKIRPPVYSVPRAIPFVSAVPRRPARIAHPIRGPPLAA